MRDDVFDVGGCVGGHVGHFLVQICRYGFGLEGRHTFLVVLVSDFVHPFLDGVVFEEFGRPVVQPIYI